MSETNNGGPAFPSDKDRRQGITMRDYIAAQAFSAVFASYIEQNRAGCATDHAFGNVAALAYKYADAMLKAREGT
jgi:hypothetical protein